jgi:hypothetical protein
MHRSKTRILANNQFSWSSILSLGPSRRDVNDVPEPRCSLTEVVDVALVLETNMLSEVYKGESSQC